ncbi:MAG: recombinase family protein, partial [Anaerolineae bacterium]
MKLFGYARYSSVQQQAGYSIEAQVDAIRHWAGANGHHICGFYIDRARSAFKDVKKRGAFQKMITALLAGEAEGVVIHKLDRFARNEEDSVIYAAMLRREGKRLFSVTEPMVGGDSPTDRLTEGMLRVLAEFYSLLLGAESKKGTSAMARRGLWPQHPPFGYRRDPETKILLPDENSEIVREAFLEMVSGRWTMRGWTAEAKRRGYRTPAGRPIAYSQWYAIFKRRLYTGII